MLKEIRTYLREVKKALPDCKYTAAELLVEVTKGINKLHKNHQAKFVAMCHGMIHPLVDTAVCQTNKELNKYRMCQLTNAELRKLDVSRDKLKQEVKAADAECKAMRKAKTYLTKTKRYTAKYVKIATIGAIAGAKLDAVKHIVIVNGVALKLDKSNSNDAVIMNTVGTDYSGTGMALKTKTGWLAICLGSGKKYAVSAFKHFEGTGKIVKEAAVKRLKTFMSETKRSPVRKRRKKAKKK